MAEAEVGVGLHCRGIGFTSGEFAVDLVSKRYC